MRVDVGFYYTKKPKKENSLVLSLPMEIMKTKQNSGFSSFPKVPHKEKSTYEIFVSA